MKLTDKQRTKLEKLADELAGLGVLPLDVTDKKSVKAVKKNLESALKKVDSILAIIDPPKAASPAAAQ